MVPGIGLCNPRESGDRPTRYADSWVHKRMVRLVDGQPFRTNDPLSQPGMGSAPSEHCCGMAVVRGVSDQSQTETDLGDRVRCGQRRFPSRCSRRWCENTRGCTPSNEYRLHPHADLPGKPSKRRRNRMSGNPRSFRSGGDTTSSGLLRGGHPGDSQQGLWRVRSAALISGRLRSR